MTRTTIGTTLQRAVFAIPPCHTQACTVFALAVFVAARVTQLHIARISTPTVVTLADIRHAMTMHATVQITQLLGAILPGPLWLARAGLCIEVKSTMTRTVR